MVQSASPSGQKKRPAKPAALDTVAVTPIAEAVPPVEFALTPTPPPTTPARKISKVGIFAKISVELDEKLRLVAFTYRRDRQDIIAEALEKHLSTYLMGQQ